MLDFAKICKQLQDPRCPNGTRVSWTSPYLVFLAECGIIPPEEQTPGELLYPTDTRQPVVMLEFFAYATYGGVNPHV